MSSFPGLARYDAIQRAPLGTYSALRRPSPVASQYKRQSEMYGQALRTLSRAARRGDAGAAIDAIKLRDQANADGFTPGGIGRSEDFNVNVTNREQELMRRNQIAEQENSFVRDRLDRRYRSEFDREPAGNGNLPTRESNPVQMPVNPRSTSGAGRGTPLGVERRAGPVVMSKWGDPANIEDAGVSNVGESPMTILPKKTSFAEEEAAKRERLSREKLVTKPNWWSTNRV